MKKSFGNRLDQIRDEFLAHGYLAPADARQVRPEVLLSWQRSLLSGAHRASSSLPFEPPAINDSLLLRAADPILTQLAEDLSGLKVGLLVADRHSRILKRWAKEKSFAARLDTIGSAVGFSGAETVVGTNGIGTVAEERRPHMIVGSEHFSEFLSPFTCVGAPVQIPGTNRLHGVVTLTAYSEEFSPLLAPLLTNTGRDIGRNLLELSSRGEQALLNAFLEACRSGRAIAVVGTDLFMANVKANDRLRGIEQTMLWSVVSDAVTLLHPERTINFTTESTMLSIHCSAVELRGEMIGAVLEIEVVDAPHHSVTLPAHPQLTGTPSLAQKRLSVALPGTSSAWMEVLRQIKAYSGSGAPLTVFGSPGTGKTSVLRAIFDSAMKPALTVLQVQTVDCSRSGAVGESWLASVVESLHGGLPLILQHLDTLDDEMAIRLTAELDAYSEPLDRGLVHATACRQENWPASDAHRRLLDRVAVNKLELPSLQDRRQDIGVLLKQINARHCPGRTFVMTQGAVNALTRAPWPGNIRQLESVLRGLFASARSTKVTLDMLPPEIASYASRRDLSMIEQLEVDGIINALTQCQGNKVAAALILGMARSTLYRKMHEYKLDSERFLL